MALLGGHVLYGPAEQGGYRVTARVPLPGEPSPRATARVAPTILPVLHAERVL